LDEVPRDKPEPSNNASAEGPPEGEVARTIEMMVPAAMTGESKPAESKPAESKPAESRAERPRTVPPPPPRPRTVPPPMSEEGRMTDPSAAPLRTSDPGSVLASDELAASELLSDDELGKPIESPLELDASELESEATTVFQEASPLELAAASSPGDPIAGESEREDPSQIIEVQDPDPSDPDLRAAELEAPLELPDNDDAMASEPTSVLEPAIAPPAPQHAPASIPPTSSPGVIVMQRTIAIGVGAPTHTTTAEERESAPPSEPAFELSDSEIDPDADLEFGIEDSAPEAGVVEAAAEEPGEEANEELEELEVESEARPKPSLKPPPAPHGAPPPPPREAHRPPPPPKPPAPAAIPPDPETGKRGRKKWWEEFFNDDYFRTVPLPQPRTILAESSFIVERLRLPPGSTILDVGCGLGLHAIELTRAGYNVVGLDLSLPMLSRAADEAQDQGLKINFLQADMRELAFESMFDAVYCWGTTFGYFDDDQNRLVVERLHRALKPGGLLLLDVVNRDYVTRSVPNSAWFQGDGCVVMEEMNCNYINSRLTVKRQVMLDDGRQNETLYTIRLYSLHELGQILHQRGFRVVEVSGRHATPGVFFGADSPQLIIVAERRPDAPTGSSKRPEDPSSGSGESQQMSASREPKSEPAPPPVVIPVAAAPSDDGRTSEVPEAIDPEPIEEEAGLSLLESESDGEALPDPKRN
jgi:SAM-dependent methyltransferase